MFKFLSNLFGKTQFGLYICDDYIEATLLKGSPKNPQIIASGKKALQPGIVQNGAITNNEELAKQIKELLSETKPEQIKDLKCILSLPSSRTFEQVFFLGKDMAAAQIRKYMDENLEEVFPLRGSDIKYKIKIMPLAKTRVVFVVATDQNITNSYIETLRKNCGLEPIIIEPRHFSIGRAIKADLTKDDGIIIIDQNETKINWVLLWKGEIFDNSSVSIEDLPEDINTSIKYFEDKCKRKVSEIIVAANKEKADKITKSLQQPSMKITQMEEISVAGGAALRALNNNDTQINLV